MEILKWHNNELTRLLFLTTNFVEMGMASKVDLINRGKHSKLLVSGNFY